jgi:hypothetical protein
MAKHVGEQFKDQRVLLDGESYERCEFNKCVIVYGGGPLSDLVGCSFHECRFELEDAAQRTLEFLNAIYHGFGNVGMRLVEETFISIRRPRAARSASGGRDDATGTTDTAKAAAKSSSSPASKSGSGKPAAASSGGKRSK